MGDLNTELFIIDGPGPGLLWTIHGAGYEDHGEVRTKVVEGRALREVAEVGGTDSTINSIERSQQETKNTRTSGCEGLEGDPTTGRR